MVVVVPLTVMLLASKPAAFSMDIAVSSPLFSTSGTMMRVDAEGMPGYLTAG